MLWVGRLGRWYGEFGGFGGLGATSKWVESVDRETPACLDHEASLELRRCYDVSHGAFPATCLIDLTRKDLSFRCQLAAEDTPDCLVETAARCDDRAGVSHERRKWIGNTFRAYLGCFFDDTIDLLSLEIAGSIQLSCLRQPTSQLIKRQRLDQYFLSLAVSLCLNSQMVRQKALESVTVGGSSPGQVI